MKIKKVIVFFSVLIMALILSKDVYAKENDYTILPTKNIDGKEVIYGIDDKNNRVSQIINNNNFNMKYTIKAFKNNVELNDEQILGTNTVIRIYDGNNLLKEYYVLIYGDVIGDGKISAIDSLAIVKNKIGRAKIKGEIYLEAGRIFESDRLNGNIPNSVDALAIIKYRLERYMIVQNFNEEDIKIPSWNDEEKEEDKTDIDNQEENKNDNNNEEENKNDNNNEEENKDDNNNGEDNKDNNNNEEENKNDENQNEENKDDTDVSNETPVGIHGNLSVVGNNIVDKNLNKYQLKGVSTHGIAWFPQYVNKETFEHMRDEWGINAIRLAMYSDPNAGYSLEQHKVVKAGVNYATELGMYVIIDWHILSDGNPNMYKSQAINFFIEMATEYKDNNNVIYEICNEPNGDVQWDRDIKPYAQEVIAKIRSIDSDAIIICGTPTWSQDVDIVANSPIIGYDNIVYTLHFYAGTHKQYLRDKAQTAINAGLPLFVSEFGISDASGNGNLDEVEGDTWIDFLNENNISWMCWNLSNKNESSSLLSSSTNKITGWTNDELSQEGRWLLRALKR